MALKKSDIYSALWEACSFFPRGIVCQLWFATAPDSLIESGAV